MMVKADNNQKIEINSKSAINNSRVQGLLRDLDMDKARREAADGDVGTRFLEKCFPGWMAELRAAVSEGSAHDASTIKGMKVRFIVYQLEHHFCPSNACKRVRNAYRYLNIFFDADQTVAARHSEFALRMIKRIELAYTKNVQIAGGEVRAWFANRMCVIFMAIGNPKFKEYSQIVDMIFFLQAIERYFNKWSYLNYFCMPFRYLGHYFSAYPIIGSRQSEKALDMIARIYQSMGYEFNSRPEVKPGFKDIEVENLSFSMGELLDNPLVALAA